MADDEYIPKSPVSTGAILVLILVVLFGLPLLSKTLPSYQTVDTVYMEAHLTEFAPKRPATPAIQWSIPARTANETVSVPAHQRTLPGRPDPNAPIAVILRVITAIFIIICLVWFASPFLLKAIIWR
jgi:hypothetical protein